MRSDPHHHEDCRCKEQPLAQFLDFENRSSSSVRIEIYQVAGGLIKERPLIGVGPGLFQAAYPDVPVELLHIAHVANAIAAYESVTFTFEDSPFDRYILGDNQALTAAEKRGAFLFYGQAGCASCHSSGLLTDQQFHHLAVPQLGPGKEPEEPLDFGRYRESGDPCDLFAFRTPPLRDVALTGPWMHNGAYATLEAVVRHHLNPVNALLTYDASQLAPDLRVTVLEDAETLNRMLSAPGLEPKPVPALTDGEIASILAFLEALTSPSAIDLTRTIPARVPSGLQVGGN